MARDVNQEAIPGCGKAGQGAQPFAATRRHAASGRQNTSGNAGPLIRVTERLFLGGDWQVRWTGEFGSYVMPWNAPFAKECLKFHNIQPRERCGGIQR